MKSVADSKAVIIDGNKLKEMFNSGSLLLEQKKKEIDSLNVFPVPDGDTGTNMNLTFRAAFKSAEKVQSNSIHDVAGAASTGSLMGARGNSGVILSQIMRGIAKGLEGIEEANGQQFSHALQVGVETAYKAVMRPVEGTILTVSRDLAKGAANKAKSGEVDIVEILKAGYEKGEAALARTPEMLPVLKQAGVVDAGGKGFLTIVSGWIAALEGTSLVADADIVDSEEIVQKPTSGITTIEDLEFPYCTEFLVKGENLEAERIKQGLLTKGDCLLVVGDKEIVKIHIHTKNPGQILDYALQYGDLYEVQISNMMAQNEAAAHKNKNENYSDIIMEGTGENIAEKVDNSSVSGAVPEFKEYGLVAVAMGDGIAEIFKSLGVDEIVFGGQTMNPSTSDLAEAVLKVPARNIYILPNNGNIIMAANQVNEVVKDRNVFVIPTKSVPQAIAALLAFNSDNNPDTNKEEMSEILSQVVSGEVTYAVRNSVYGDLHISEGDIIGLVEGKITATGRDILDVAKKILESMQWREKDLVTIYYGKDMIEEDVKILADWLENEKPDIEVEIYAGKQPLYYYIFGVE